MDHSERGTKRICPTTGRKFYDLNRDPVISPYTGEIVPTSAAASFTRSSPPAFSRSKAVVEEEEPETEGPEIVSLDEVEAEEADASDDSDTGGDDDLNIKEDADTADDDTLIEDEDDDSASDLVDVENDDED